MLASAFTIAPTRGRYFRVGKLEERSRWMQGTVEHGLKKVAVSCLSDVTVCHLIKYGGSGVRDNEWLWARVLDLGAQALCAACEGGHLNILEAMFTTHSDRGLKKEAARLAKLKKSAAATVKIDSDDKTPFICACEAGSVECAAFIRQYISEKDSKVQRRRTGLPLVNMPPSSTP